MATSRVKTIFVNLIETIQCPQPVTSEGLWIAILCDTSSKYAEVIEYHLRSPLLPKFLSLVERETSKLFSECLLIVRTEHNPQDRCFRKPHLPRMSLAIPQASQAGLFKPGYSSYDAEDGAIIRNVSILRPSYRPQLRRLPDRRLSYNRIFCTNLPRTIWSQQDRHQPPLENDTDFRRCNHPTRT